MEEKGYIKIRVTNKEDSLTPGDIDINEVKEFISDIETFLFPTRQEKQKRPHISYSIEKGSAVQKFVLPITGVILFNGLLNEIKTRNNLDFLDYKRQAIIDKFQQAAVKEGYIMEFSSSLSKGTALIIDSNTKFEKTAPAFYEGEFYLYGEIYQEGGKNPNLHISTKEFGNLKVAATKEQIMEGEKKTYKVYGLKVRGKKFLEDDSLTDLELIEYILYEPVFNRAHLEKVMEKASANLSKIRNVDAWLKNVKAEGI